jgi:hypothetical protein
VRFPWVVAVHPSVPASTFQELVAYARAKPGALSYALLGVTLCLPLGCNPRRSAARSNIIGTPV